MSMVPGSASLSKRTFPFIATRVTLVPSSRLHLLTLVMRPSIPVSWITPARMAILERRFSFAWDIILSSTVFPTRNQPERSASTRTVAIRSVMRPLRVLICLTFLLEPESPSPDGKQDPGVLRVLLYLSPESEDVHIHRAGVGRRITPDPGQEGVP